MCAEQAKEYEWTCRRNWVVSWVNSAYSPCAAMFGFLTWIQYLISTPNYRFIDRAMREEVTVSKNSNGRQDEMKTLTREKSSSVGEKAFVIYKMIAPLSLAVPSANGGNIHVRCSRVPTGLPWLKCGVKVQDPPCLMQHPTVDLRESRIDAENRLVRCFRWPKYLSCRMHVVRLARDVIHVLTDVGKVVSFRSK